MKTVHAGMHITDAHFNALVEDLERSLDKFSVPAKEQGELLGTLGSLKPQIVGQQRKRRPPPRPGPGRSAASGARRA